MGELVDLAAYKKQKEEQEKIAEEKRQKAELDATILVRMRITFTDTKQTITLSITVSHYQILAPHLIGAGTRWFHTKEPRSNPEASFSAILCAI